MLDLATGFSKIIPTPHAVTQVTFTREGDEMFALSPDPVGANHLVHRVATGSLALIPYATVDAPIFVGACQRLAKSPSRWTTQPVGSPSSIPRQVRLIRSTASNSMASYGDA